MTTTLLLGDCLERMAEIEAGSVDAIATDPPYGLEFMGKEWDAPWQASSSSKLFGDRKTEMPGWGVTRNPTCRTCGGRLRGAKKCGCDEPNWDESLASTKARQMAAFQAWNQRWAEAALRILKPGGYMVAFGGTRTFHRQVCAIEDAGFEVRDCLMWLYGQGFPKGKGCLKPGWEPITLARKPGPKVLPLGIDACRIGSAERPLREADRGRFTGSAFAGGMDGSLCGSKAIGTTTEGRWPANVVHDGSEEVMEAFAAFGEKTSGTGAVKRATGAGWKSGSMRGPESRPAGTPNIEYGDTGSAARFFYAAKASKADRGDGNTHPTVKPTALMRWLVRLIARPGDLLADPFTGSGSTGVACIAEGVDFLGFEQSPGYHAIAESRIAAARSARAAS